MNTSQGRTRKERICTYQTNIHLEVSLIMAAMKALLQKATTSKEDNMEECWQPC